MRNKNTYVYRQIYQFEPNLAPRDSSVGLSDTLCNVTVHPSLEVTAAKRVFSQQNGISPLKCSEK